MYGRFAPSPTGDLHVGNLRTALAAWLAARASGRGFLVRMEDLDLVTASAGAAARQLDDLAALGLDWDGEVVVQSERFDRYREALDRLAADGRVYPCFCTRREIRAELAAAAQAPHGRPPGPPGGYPGTCRDLTADQVAARRAEGRPAALRLRTDHETLGLTDRIAGYHEGAVDDVVLQRADGVPAYNLAVVVDDALQGVSQVVRGGDLLESTPRQLLLQRLLGHPHPEYVHVPLVVDDSGNRLAKRHTAVTLGDLTDAGWTPAEVRTALARSLGIDAAPGAPPAELVERFDLAAVPREPIRLGDLLDRRGR